MEQSAYEALDKAMIIEEKKMDKLVSQRLLFVCVCVLGGGLEK